ncbi:DUF402 domain-containing protein [Paenibacillus glycanilyticus]|uniref:DUF402 domain-containing protein n=1 Tax=Paenibacillus glycanilyticus TaxID=126569 RepID=UPI000FD8DBE6|nr:DUF402 domain-containing protein [Paenibacillus glycanilyticus]
MLKRKYGDRADWQRVMAKEYAQTFIESEEFTGFVTLLHITKVADSLFVQYGDQRLCIADNGYLWLQHFPIGCNYSVTTTFNSAGQIVQWYIDICSWIGIGENNVPWMEDLYLDLILLPSGELIRKDTDELEDALTSGIIDKSLYELAWEEADKMSKLIECDEFDLVKLSVKHKEILWQKLQANGERIE